MQLIVKSPKEAIEVQRVLQQAITSNSLDHSKTDVDKASVNLQLCKIRDSVVVSDILKDGKICIFKQADYKSTLWKCSECKFEWFSDMGSSEDFEMKFCPGCGLEIIAIKLQQFN